MAWMDKPVRKIDELDLRRQIDAMKRDIAWLNGEIIKKEILILQMQNRRRELERLGAEE